eukprot:6198229-Pleurochrysis_carterae.AAC.1
MGSRPAWHGGAAPTRRLPVSAAGSRPRSLRPTHDPRGCKPSSDTGIAIQFLGNQHSSNAFRLLSAVGDCAHPRQLNVKADVATSHCTY